MARRREHWACCDDCGTPVRECGCDEHQHDHYVAVPNKWGGGVRPVGLLCGECEHERAKEMPGFKL